MDLEYLNRQYKALKDDLNNVKQELEDIKRESDRLNGDKVLETANLELAKRRGIPSVEEQSKNNIKKIDKELETLRKKAEAKERLIGNLKADLEAKIAQVKSNPDMEEHLNQVLVKKYDRKLSKLEKEKKDKTKEKEQLTEKKDRFETLQQIVKKSETIKNNLTGFLVAKKQIDDLNNELKGLEIRAGVLVTYSDPARADRIKNVLLPAANNKLTKNKNLLINNLGKKKLKITDQDLNELYNNGFTLNAQGKLNIDDTFNKSISVFNTQIKTADKQIKGMDKSIADYQSALSKHGRIHTAPEATSTSTPTTTTPETVPEPEDKPKWWQFIKRFKNWNEKRKQPEQPQLLPANEVTRASINEEFRTSMKYDLVKDAVEKMQTDERKEAKAERKAATAESREEDGSR